MKRSVFIIFILLLVIFQTQGFCTPNKHALIIGNSDYKEAPLRNPVNDANDMTSILQRLGFSVITKTNIRYQEMENAIWQFGQQLKADDIALFYFSGHGVQVNGNNYLLPIGIKIKSARDIKYKAVNASMILDTLEDAGSRLNLIILDACRNNPFKRVRSLQNGLAMMSAPTGTLIAYATAPGSVAYDGEGRNSPYTQYLLETMKIPGLKIEEVFKKVRVSVTEKTNNEQVPWEASSLIGDFYFNLDKSSASVMPPQVSKPEEIDDNKGYKLFWDGKRVGYEPEWAFKKGVENLLWNKKTYPSKDVQGWYNGKKILVSGIGYELFFDGERVGHEPKWTFEQGIKNFLWNTQQYPKKKVQSFYNGIYLVFSGIGYELFFDGKRVGHEPEWSLEKAVENLDWNKRKYSEKSVQGFYNGKKM